jgi:hypothetical protein
MASLYLTHRRYEFSLLGFWVIVYSDWDFLPILRTRLHPFIPLSSPKGDFPLCTALIPEFEDWQKVPKESQGYTSS